MVGTGKLQVDERIVNLYVNEAVNVITFCAITLAIALSIWLLSCAWKNFRGK